ncbi:helix-turn-helix domain-containing protein [Bradyrhizobium sp. C-145]|uniref:helix-turn-helix domain-containing protein n=1 Tax=Bradyrhizobium sp. C-145 TaxID=574727 RepID=UPI00201B8C87|nr:helix-turn-helix transcriptional regulator [Bradyrhizobium sp. C-145]UQR61611.1 helix-turn-helix domain-containing protein [Bradyrhizobium sp. C-145]
MILKTISDLGLAVREARRRRKLTQKQLAQTLGTTQEWISQFETGRLENPSLGTVLKAFATLGIDLNIDSVPGSLQNNDLDTGDLALDEPSFLKGRRR